MSCEVIQTHPYTWTENDTLPELMCQVSELDLTSYTVTLHMERPTGSAVLVKTATMINAAAGTFKFTFATGDLVAGQNQPAEVQFDDGSGGILTSPKFIVNVDREIA